MRRLGIDFIGPKSQPTLGWLLLVVGACSVAIVIQQEWALHRQAAALDLERQQRNAQTAAHEQARQAALPAPKPSYADDKRWMRAARELNLPWIATLHAIEQATKPPVFLTSFKSDPASGRLLLEAEAPDFDAALKFVSGLQTTKGLTRTQLLSNDQGADSQGRPLVRFTLQTQWVASP